MKGPLLISLCFAGLFLAMGSGCQTVYNSTMENVFGYEKRELLKKSVTALRQDQQQAQAEFKDAMTRLKELYAFQGGGLEKSYNQVRSAYDRCEAEAKDVHRRVENMEGIAHAMFAEWGKEIKQYTNPALAENSRRQLQETKERYAQLSTSVRASEASMKSVLAQLKDQVLVLKHNLNAAAIGSLKGEAAGIQSQLEALIASINSSIAEADTFIESLAKK